LGGGKTLRRPNLIETTALVAGRYVSQQRQFALVSLESHAREFHYDVRQELKTGTESQKLYRNPDDCLF
jgi:hypothetical protein